MIIGSFNSKDGWNHESHKIFNYKLKNRIDDIEYYKVIMSIEENMIILEERYNILNWNEISVKIV